MEQFHLLVVRHLIFYGVRDSAPWIVCGLHDVTASSSSSANQSVTKKQHCIRIMDLTKYYTIVMMTRSKYILEKYVP